MLNRYSYSGMYQETIRRVNAYLNSLQDESQFTASEKALLLEVFAPQENPEADVLTTFAAKINAHSLYDLPSKLYEKYIESRSSMDLNDHGLAMLATQVYQKLGKDGFFDEGDGQILWQETVKKKNYLIFFNQYPNSLTEAEEKLLDEVFTEYTHASTAEVLKGMCAKIKAQGLYSLPEKIFHQCKSNNKEDFYAFDLAKLAIKCYRELGRSEKDMTSKKDWVAKEARLLRELMPYSFFGNEQNRAQLESKIERSIKKREMQLNAPVFEVSKAEGLLTPVQVIASKVFLEEGIKPEEVYQLLQLLFEVEDLRPIIKILAFEAEHNPKFNILLLNNWSVAKYGDHLSSAGEYNSRSTLRIGYRSMSTPLGALFKSNHVIGTLIHEMTHYAMTIINERLIDPWPKSHADQRQPEFDKLTLEMLALLEQYAYGDTQKEESKEEEKSFDRYASFKKAAALFSPERGRSRIMDEYSRGIWHTIEKCFYPHYAENNLQYTELVVRYPERLAMGTPYQALEQLIKPLIQFHKQFSQEVEKYLETHVNPTLKVQYLGLPPPAVSNEQFSYVLDLLLALLNKQKISLEQIFTACLDWEKLINFIFDQGQASKLLTNIIVKNDLKLMSIVLADSNKIGVFSTAQQDEALILAAERGFMELVTLMKTKRFALSEDAKKKALFWFLRKNEPQLSRDKPIDNLKYYTQFKNLIALGADLYAEYEERTVASAYISSGGKCWLDFLLDEIKIKLDVRDRDYFTNRMLYGKYREEEDKQYLHQRLASAGIQLDPRGPRLGS